MAPIGTKLCQNLFQTPRRFVFQAKQNIQIESVASNYYKLNLWNLSTRRILQLLEFLGTVTTKTMYPTLRRGLLKKCWKTWATLSMRLNPTCHARKRIRSSSSLEQWKFLHIKCVQPVSHVSSWEKPTCWSMLEIHQILDLLSEK